MLGYSYYIDRHHHDGRADGGSFPYDGYYTQLNKDLLITRKWLVDVHVLGRVSVQDTYRVRVL